MDQFAVLKEVYTVIDDCDETNKNISVSIDDYDPMCSSLSPWTMTPQVSSFFILIIIFKMY